MHAVSLRASLAALAIAALAGAARAEGQARDSARSIVDEGPRIRVPSARPRLRLELPPAPLPPDPLAPPADPDALEAERWGAVVARAAEERRAALWGRSVAGAFAWTPLPGAEPVSALPTPSDALLAPPAAPPGAPAAAADTAQSGLIEQYTDLGLQLNTRIEAKVERNKNERCTSTDLLVPTSNCLGNYQPQFDFQFDVKTGGTVADRVHVNVDYDSQREFDASNSINVYYQGQPDEILHRLEVGNVSFQLPPSRFITGGIPSGNYGLQATGQLGPMRFRGIVAQQKGNVVKDRIFTIGDRTVQGAERDIEDWQVERRRFFWVVDPARELASAYPNIDILDAPRLDALAAAIPSDRRPRRVLVYRYRPPAAQAAGGGTARDINGPHAVTIGARDRNEIGPYEVLQQGVDYYLDPSNLWIALVNPIQRGERLAVSYSVTGPGGGEATIGSVGGTLPTRRGAAGADTVVLLWDAEVLPGDSAFTREMRNVYRLGGEEIQRSSVELKVVVGSGGDQEQSQAAGAPTFLQRFGLAQPTNPSAFDATNRLWPRETDPNLAANAGGGSTRLIRDYFVVFPSLRPFADAGLADPPDPVNDSLYVTPDEDLFSQRRPPTQYRLRARYQAEGGGSAGTLALGAVQVRQGSERLTMDGRELRRDIDYSIDYELGQVTFLRPDTLFATPRQVVARFEENPLFATQPTSILGFSSEFPLANNGRIGFVAISQSQRTTFNRPPLGFEPASSLMAGVSGTFNWEANGLTRALDALPGVATAAPSYVSLQGEFAASRPTPNSSGTAYVESFEGEGGIPVSLNEAQWRVGSQPAIAGPGSVVGGLTFDFDTAAAATLAWQNLGYVVDSTTGRRAQIQFYPDQIDPLLSFAGRQAFRVPEQVLWLTLYPRSIGGFPCRDCAEPRWRWTMPERTGRRWRSISQPLGGTTGVDLTRVENLELWALVDTALAARAKNPSLVIDFGDVSENSVAFAPETLTVRTVTEQLPGGGSRTVTDSTFTGRQLVGFDRLDTERDSLTRAFDVSRDDTGIPGDVVDRLVRVDADAGSAATVLSDVALCSRGFDVLLDLGDPAATCTVNNRRLDEEDLDLNGFLNFGAGARDAERILRYTVDLSDRAQYTRVGQCFRGVADTLPPGAAGTVCWVQVRVPFTAPTERINDPLVRRVKAMRLTVVSSPAADEDDVAQLPIARLRLVGSPWVKRAERAIAGAGGATTGGAGYVIATVVGTQDRDANGLFYESPPGVTDEADDRSADYQVGAVQVNERSLRLIAGDVPLHHRAEAFYRFPEGEKNFMAYRQLRVWGRGRGKGWGPQGDLQMFVKVGRGQDDFYMYRTPVNAGPARDAWLPEVRVDLERFIALRARLQNAFLRGGTRVACTGLDSALVAASADAAGKWAACDDGYIVFSANPGVTPPNLAAVQELAVGMVRVSEDGFGTGGAILPADSLELWVDDIRLTGVVDDVGFAGQLALNVGAADIGTLQVSLSRRDRNFRQLAEQPTYQTDDQLAVSSSLRLDRFLPSWWGWAMPVTASYTSSGTDPFFLARSDVRADGIEGLRTPRSHATAYSIAVRRSTPVTNRLLAPIVNNLGLSATYGSASSRSEYSSGSSSNFTGSLDWTLAAAPRTARIPGLDALVGLLPGWLESAAPLRSLRGLALRWTPAQLRLTTSYARASDRREAFTLPIDLGEQTEGRLVTGLNDLLRQTATVELRPFEALGARLDVSTLRDLRDYGDSTAAGGWNVGAIARAERERFLGMDVGLERERQVGMAITYAPAFLAWLRPRADLTTQFNLLRDPNTAVPLRLDDSLGGGFRLPRRLGNAQGLGLGASIDLARSIGPVTGAMAVLRRLTMLLQPIDVAWRRDLRSTFDGVAFDPGLGYQLPLGSVGDFRESDGTPATAAGVTRSLTANGGLALPFGASLVARYAEATSTAWTRRLGFQSVLETEQVTFPDLSLRWSFQPTPIRGILSSVGIQAGMRRTRASTFQPTVGEGTSLDAATGVRDEQESTQWSLTPSLTWPVLGNLSTAGGWTRTERTRLRSGGITRGEQTDITATVGRSFRLPASWNLGTDLRWSAGWQQSDASEFFDADGERRRVSGNGRRGFNTNADTDVSETMTFSLAFARNVTFDDLFDRRFTQTVLTATLHLRFFAGAIR